MKEKRGLMLHIRTKKLSSLLGKYEAFYHYNKSIVGKGKEEKKKAPKTLHTLRQHPS